MEPKRSHKRTPKSLSWLTPNTNRSLQPDLSEDQNFTSVNTSATKNLSEKSNPLECRTSRENIINSVQASTQHSINFKQSFSIPGSVYGKDFGEVYNHSEDSSLKSTLRSELKIALREGCDEEKEIHQRFETVEVSTKNVESKKVGIEKERLWKSEGEFGKGFVSAGEKTVFEGDLQIPQLKWCAFCRAEVMTKVLYVSNSKTFWSAVGIFLSGGVCGCFLLPYMSSSCKGVRVVCHTCDRVLI